MLSTTIAAPAAAQIALRDVSHAFRTARETRTALDGVSLEIRSGEFLSIIGPSGCGKSTLLRLAAGLLPLQSGSLQVNGAVPRRAQQAGAFGITFQDAALLPWRTVLANVRLPLEVQRRRGTPVDPRALLSLVGLSGFDRYYPHQLSGGMQQRAALARALVTDPPILLMDEPFAALDEITRTELRHELLRITAQTRKTVLFVTHSLAEAVLLSDRVAVMSGAPGRIRTVIDIDLPRPRTADNEDAPQFLGYVRRLRSLLREDSDA